MLSYRFSYLRQSFVASSLLALLHSSQAWAQADSAPTVPPGSAEPKPANVAPVAAPGTASTATESGPAPNVLTRAPKLIKFVPATFPEAERAKQKSASVLLEILISETGAVGDVRVVNSAGAEFDAAALQAVRGFVFEPAWVDDKPAPIKIQYRYEFNLEEAPVGPTILRGTVFSRGTNSSGGGQPLAGVVVRLDTGDEVTTDAEGKFSFEGLPPGRHTVLLSGPKLAALQASETLREGVTLEVRYEVVVVVDKEAPGQSVDVDDLELVIIAPKLGYQVVATRVEATAARRVAGTQGDVLKVVENMPGVARASAGSGDVVVWGAAPLDTRVYVDSVRVPALYHFGGLRSVVHSDLVRSVELVPGAYGAPYGRGLGGLVTVDTIDPDAERLHGSLQLDVLDASAALQGKVTDDLRIAAAIRRSHLQDIAQASVFDRAREAYLIPSYSDASVRVRYQTEPASFFEVGALGSRDSSTRSAGGDDPVARRRETRELGFERVFMRYQREPGDGSRVSVVPWVGRDRQALHGVFGFTPVELEVDSVVSGLRVDWTGPFVPHASARLGIDIDTVTSEVSRRGSIAAPPREGDARVFGQPPADQINTDEWDASTASAAPYFETDIGLLDNRLHIVPGLRIEPYFVSVGRRRPAEGAASDVGVFAAELSVQPRASVRYELTKDLLLKAAAGRYRQPPVAEDLSSVFGNPLLGTSEATHALVGAAYRATRLLSVEATAFAANSKDLPVRNPIASPRVAEALVGVGEGRARGVQLMIKRELADRFFGWVAYTLLRSERKDSPTSDWRAFDYDQTHVFTALGSYDLGKGFEVGARVRVATGYPRTPVLGAYYDGRRDQFEPILGASNSTRIPTFWQLDARLAKSFKLGSTELETYLDVQNVTNRDNPEEIVYNANYSEREFIRGLPLLPVLGARWSF